MKTFFELHHQLRLYNEIFTTIETHGFAAIEDKLHTTKPSVHDECTEESNPLAHKDDADDGSSALQYTSLPPTSPRDDHKPQHSTAMIQDNSSEKSNAMQEGQSGPSQPISPAGSPTETPISNVVDL